MCTERVVSTARNDNMVQKTHVKELSSLGNTFRERYILLAWFGASRGMVMHQYNLRRKELQRPAYHHLAIYHRRLNTTLADARTLDRKSVV